MTTSPPCAAPDLPTLRRWLQETGDDPVALFGPAEQPDAIGIWYPTHLQLARLHLPDPLAAPALASLPLVLLQTTFCAMPRRRGDVLSLLAQTNQQLERGRWYVQRDPTRLTYAMELPATLLDATRLRREWQRFFDEAVAHGIELTLRTRGIAYVDLLRAQARTRRIA